MRKEIESTFKRRWIARVCRGVLTFFTVLGVSGVYAQELAKKNVAKDEVALAMKELERWHAVATSTRGEMIMKATGQTLGSAAAAALKYEKEGIDASALGVPSTTEMIAAHFLHARETLDFVYSAVKSIKIVPLSDSSRNAVRVLFSDGSVRYYDGLARDDVFSGGRLGLSELPNAPCDETIEAIPEFGVGPGGFDNWICRLYRATKERAGEKNEREPRNWEQQPDFKLTVEKLTEARNACLEWLRSSGNDSDRRLTLEALASVFASQNTFLQCLRKSAIQSIKIVPLGSPKEWSSTYGAVRVLFSDGSVRYYDEDELDGEREPANAPSAETVAQISEYALELRHQSLNNDDTTRIKKRLRAMNAPSTEPTK